MDSEAISVRFMSLMHCFCQYDPPIFKIIDDLYKIIDELYLTQAGYTDG